MINVKDAHNLVPRNALTSNDNLYLPSKGTATDPVNQYLVIWGIDLYQSPKSLVAIVVFLTRESLPLLRSLPRRFFYVHGSSFGFNDTLSVGDQKYCFNIFHRLNFKTIYLTKSRAAKMNYVIK